MSDPTKKIRVIVDGHEHTVGDKTETLKKGAVISVDDKLAAVLIAQKVGEPA